MVEECLVWLKVSPNAEGRCLQELFKASISV